MTFRNRLLSLWFVMCSIIWPIQLVVDGYGFRIYYFFAFGVLLIWLLTQKLVDIKVTKALILLVVIGIASISITFINGICHDQYEKFFKTFPAFIILTIVGYSIGLQSSISSWIGLYKPAIWIILIIIFGLLIEFFFPEFFPATAPYREQFKYSGFFSEPSHLSYSAFPSILLLITSSKGGIRALGVIALLTLMIFSRTSTLMVLVLGFGIFYLIIKFNIKRLFMGIMMILIGLISINILSFEYLLTPFIERLEGIFAGGQIAKNISSLVYLQGVQDGLDGLIRSYGIGIGFNMMGCNPLPISSARDTISSMGIPPLNSEDGSFLLSKIVAEFGVVGILFICYLISITFKIRNLYFKESEKYRKEAYWITLVILIACLEVFSTRSSGYFYGPFFLIPVILGGISTLRTKS